MFSSRRIALLALLSSVSLAHQQRTTPSASSSAEIIPYSSSEIAVLQVDSSVWTNAFTSVPLGSSRIPGKNMTLPYHPNSASDDWTYTLRVSDAVPVGAGGEFLTGTWVQLEAPKNLVRPSPQNASEMVVVQDDSWQVCSLIFLGPELKSDEPLPAFGCTGFLTVECITDLKKHFREGWNNPSRSGGQDSHCPDPSPKNLPASCHPDKTFGKERLGAIKNLNTTLDRVPNGWSTGDEPGGVYDLFRVSSASTSHKRGNTTAYEEAIRRVYVIGTIWGYSSSSGLANGTETSADVTCLQAGSALAKGQADDEGDGSGGGSREGSDGKSGAGPSCRVDSLLFVLLLVSLFSSW